VQQRCDDVAVSPIKSGDFLRTCTVFDDLEAENWQCKIRVLRRARAFFADVYDGLV
jgi:hypothetical protein